MTTEEASEFGASVSKAVEEAGGINTEEGQKIRDELLAQAEEYVNTKETAAETWASISENTEEAVGSLLDDFGKLAEGLDVSDETRQNGIDMITALFDGASAQMTASEGLFENLGTRAVEAMQRGIGGGVTVPQEVGSTIMSRNAIGLDYVPYNEYVASLHRGEAVLTAVEADRWRRGLDRDGNVIQTASDQQPIVTVANSSDDRVIGLLEQLLDSIGDNLQGAIASGNKGMSNRDFARAVRGVT